ncbi:MAG: YicC family protein [Phycisphaerales bacterium]|nr:YicC family protein [Phycisphaerales bacterium]
MIVSMTGCGEAVHSEGTVGYSLEIRSVNNRYFKSIIKLPDSLQFLEDRIEKLLRGELRRGSVFYQLRTHNDVEGSAASINVAVLQLYIEQLTKTRLPSGVHAQLDLGTLSALPGVCETPQPDEQLSEHRGAIVEGMTRRALASLQKMRAEEGRALLRDLSEHCTRMREQLVVIREHAPKVIAEYRDKLKQRVDRLLAEARLELDSDTLAREIALYADRCDISEELSRLASHLDQFTEACAKEDHVGRKLDFLTQELLREANTIGSKSNDVAIARCIVEMKSLIDRLKEQVQNVE